MTGTENHVRTLRPGLLVNLRTSVGGGNVQYERRDVEAIHVDENGAQRSRWETERVVQDPDELAAAIKVRGRARGIVVNVCTATGFGLLCPEEREADLDAAVMEARKLCWEFNGTAKNTQIQFTAVRGRVAQDDVKAVEAISLELQSLVGVIQAGAAELNVKKMRDAAQKMRDTGQMLSPDVKLKVDEIVKSARKMARKMAKAGEQAAAAVDEETMNQLRAARTAFLDLDADDQTDEEAAEAQQAADAARAAGTRAIDFDADAFDAWNDEVTPAEDDDDQQGAQAAAAPSPSSLALDMTGWDDEPLEQYEGRPWVDPADDTTEGN
jgi:hypothetical protein